MSHIDQEQSIVTTTALVVIQINKDLVTTTTDLSTTKEEPG